MCAFRCVCVRGQAYIALLQCEDLLRCLTWDSCKHKNLVNKLSRVSQVSYSSSLSQRYCSQCTHTDTQRNVVLQVITIASENMMAFKYTIKLRSPCLKGTRKMYMKIITSSTYISRASKSQWASVFCHLHVKGWRGMWPLNNALLLRDNLLVYSSLGWVELLTLLVYYFPYLIPLLGLPASLCTAIMKNKSHQATFFIIFSCPWNLSSCFLVPPLPSTCLSWLRL